MRNFKTMAILFALLLTAAACGDDAEDSASMTIADQPLAGTIGGTAWTAQSGSAQPSGDELSVTLYGEAVEDPCGFVDSDVPQMLFSVPNEEGEWELGFDNGRTVTFVVPPSTNTIATQGRVRIDAISDTAVTGGLVADAGADDNASGTFELTMCEPFGGI